MDRFQTKYATTLAKQGKLLTRQPKADCGAIFFALKFEKDHALRIVFKCGTKETTAGGGSNK